MITRMINVTFVGPKAEKDGFLKRLQEVGLTHLILPAEAAQPAETVRELQKVTEARKFLGKLAPKTPEPSPAEAAYAEVCARREELGAREQRLQSEITVLKKERAVVEPFGDFSVEDLALLKAKGLKAWFYRASNRVFDDLDLTGAAYHQTSRTPAETAFVVFGAEEPKLGLLEEKLPGKGLSQIEQAVRERETQLEAIRKEYTDLAQHLAALTRAEAELTDSLEYQRAQLNAGSELEERLFVVEVWSSVSEAELVDLIGPGFHLYHMARKPEEGDRVPVLLNNPPTLSSGEDLVQVYSTPNYHDFDPSGIVLYCFALFYGLIVGDAGYGLVHLALTVFLTFKIKSKAPLWIRFRRLNYMLALAIIFFGVISGSYFGIKMSPDNFLQKALLMDFTTKEGQNQVMLITIVMGMVHLSIALGIKFWRTRDLPSLGWILVMWAGFALLMDRIKGIHVPGAMYILIAGFVLVILFTSNNKNPLFRVLMGLNGAMGAIQLGADVLSYLRLFALSLATMYLCQTFNMLAGMANDAVPYVGFIPAVLILVAGHAINFGLGIMGGVVHGLRLNFLEWYRWCFEGDGLVFKPFRLISIEKP